MALQIQQLRLLIITIKKQLEIASVVAVTLNFPNQVNEENFHIQVCVCFFLKGFPWLNPKVGFLIG